MKQKNTNQVTITGCSFTNTPPSAHSLEVVMALAKAAEENAKAIQAAANSFRLEAMLIVK